MQMKVVTSELLDYFPELLKGRRSGVVAAVLAAADRTKTGQMEVAKALSAAVHKLPRNAQVCHLSTW